jgi:F-type H+-transporting ATPase subunit delta
MVDAQITPEVEPIDVGAQQVGAIYAKAFLSAAEKAKTTDALVDEFDGLIELLKQYPELETILGSSLIKHEVKLGILDRTFNGRISSTLLNFLKVLSSHGRLDVLRAIHHEVREQYDVLRGRILVQVRTAAPLSPEIAQDILQKVQGKLGGKPELQQIVDPDLIGGLVVRVGDTVFDGSVTRQLNQVREQMINRSVHEIQSRRDRFSNPG